MVTLEVNVRHLELRTGPLQDNLSAAGDAAAQVLVLARALGAGVVLSTGRQHLSAGGAGMPVTECWCWQAHHLGCPLHSLHALLSPNNGEGSMHTLCKMQM
jgi:hypothetical protein